MRILISAYASEPEAGSEYGVGWMIPLTLATNYPEHQVFVITRSRCKEKIDIALGKANLRNLHYIFYDIPSFLFYKKEMHSRWGEQYNYLLWQLMVRRVVRKENKKTPFDVFHHLTFNQYRTPSPGFWLDIPFVLGPIGGAETIPEVFCDDLGKHSQKKEKVRRKGKDRSLFKWFVKRKGNKKVILCSCRENLERLREYAEECEMRVLPAIGFHPNDISRISDMRDVHEEVFHMIYTGKAWDWKGIHIFLKSVKKAFSENDIRDFRVTLVGIRFKEEQQMVMNWVRDLNLEDYVSLIPFIRRSEMLALEKHCSLSVYPAFRDSGSMSVLESCFLGCPCICFDTGGQDVFPDNILIKVPVTSTYEDTLKSFSDKLLWAYNHRDDIKKVGEEAMLWVNDNLTWDKKVKEFVEIYRSLCQ